MAGTEHPHQAAVDAMVKDQGGPRRTKVAMIWPQCRRIHDSQIIGNWFGALFGASTPYGNLAIHTNQPRWVAYVLLYNLACTWNGSRHSQFTNRPDESWRQDSRSLKAGQGSSVDFLHRWCKMYVRFEARLSRMSCEEPLRLEETVGDLTLL